MAVARESGRHFLCGERFSSRNDGAYYIIFNIIKESNPPNILAGILLVFLYEKVYKRFGSLKNYIILDIIYIDADLLLYL